jgi:heme A synthase
MDKAYEHFSLKDTMHTVMDAAYSVFCHIIFDWAAHGLIVAVILIIISFVLASRQHRLAKPFMAIGRRLAIFSAIVAAPGLFTLVTSGKLPAVGVYNINSIGYLCFWSLICAHALGEESNYQLVVKPDQEEAKLGADRSEKVEAESQAESLAES